MATHGLSKSLTYSSWSSMKDRCTNPKSINYKRYSCVPIDPKWLSFEGFYEDMGDRPVGTSLDRIDNEKGYTKDNCRWADSFTQKRNRRCVKTNIEEVRKIRELYASGVKPRYLRAMFGMNVKHLESIIYRRKWAD